MSLTVDSHEPTPAAPRSAVDVRGGKAMSPKGYKLLVYFWLALAFASIGTVMYFQSTFQAKLPSKSTNSAAQ